MTASSIQGVLAGHAEWCIAESDCIEALRTIPDATFVAAISDVPYGLGSKQPNGDDLIRYLQGESLDTRGDFMGHKWEIPPVAFWRELVRTLKPGALVMSFAGSRTQDLVTIGMRAGGLTIDETLMWLHAEGMAKPRSTTETLIRKSARPGEAADWVGRAHALAPAHEPVVLAQNPSGMTLAQTALEHGTGTLNIGGCRIGVSGGTRKVDPHLYRTKGGVLDGSVDGSLNGGVKEAIQAGRWPKNVLATHHEDCRIVGTRDVKTGTAVKRNGVRNSGALDGMRGLGTYPEGTPDSGYAVAGKERMPAWECVETCPVRIIDDQSGERPSSIGVTRNGGGNKSFSGLRPGAKGAGARPDSGYSDTGGASRFYWTGKVSEGERELGCYDLPRHKTPDGDGARNWHPAVKPIKLTKYLAKLLLTPIPHSILCVPYAGSGSEVIGALRAGWTRVIGIERDPKFAAIARARIARWQEAARSRPDFDEDAVVRAGERPDGLQATLFSGASR